ncbi:MAG TPA: trehalose-6-phosphate synthase [Methylomirabilota bacterium]|nr:trehalose-6-phosphate synthase [Methylomirabilota bacterium]
MTARFLGAIWIATLAITGGFAFFQVREEHARLHTDLERRGALLAESLRESVEPIVRRGARPAVERLLKKFARPDRQIVVYDGVATPLVAAPDPGAGHVTPEVSEVIAQGGSRRGVRELGGRLVFVYATALQHDDRITGGLAVFLDASHVAEAEAALWRYNAVRFLVLAVGLSLITLFVLRLTVTRPVAEIAEWAKRLRAGESAPAPAVPDAALFGPIAVEVSSLARNLARARDAAEQEAALRLRGEALWTEERLKQFVRLEFGDRPLFVVSNREPVSHIRRGGGVAALTPASGVVTAIEPVMRACGGVWVAHGSGDADRVSADARGRLGLPADDPRYTLRRVWLTEEEEDGYYYGFANEGLWPLCHTVHARPRFRADDFAAYRAVNEKFAAALLDEIRDAEAPMVLVQDYHFALLPGLVKAARPDAHVAIFWHIPWPNFEAFDICPWHEAILHGMLGADLIGFHTQYHCNNFLESVERALEARIDWEHFAVIRGRQSTTVKPFPISVAPDFVEAPPLATPREALLAPLGADVEFLGVGVERIDYTKGLPERFRALGRFFELYPEYRERMTFVQLAAPSRGRIARYADFAAEVEAVVAEVNRAVGTRTWQPIVYQARHHDRREIWPYYRHADFCMVTSLHDGMNLVAKEFVSVRDDDDGALVLSRFTGAARELRDAILVNPYDLDGTAEGIRLALEMKPAERRARMTRMRQRVREHNVYRWAGLLLGELARMPVEHPVSGARP